MAFFLMTGEERDSGGDKQTGGCSSVCLEDADTGGIKGAGQSKTLISVLSYAERHEKKDGFNRWEWRNEGKSGLLYIFQTYIP